MSAPLVDIDANQRQPGLISSKASSKIPSPPKLQQPRSTGRRNPFSVSITGSPCYTGSSATSRSTISQAPTSRLPRKSTPTQSAFSQSHTYGTRPVTPRSSLPRARDGYRPTAVARPLRSDIHKTSSPLSYDKPLPSPPVAQIVNPVSPPKAQRTLIDAEAGTPTDEQWPILRPENATPLYLQTHFTDNSLLQRSVSEGSVLYHDISTGEESHLVTGPRAFGSTNPYAESFHALSTNTDEALDSPLAHKQRASLGVIIPPRISSKRNSFPNSDVPSDGADSQPLTASSRAVRPGSTKWPVLAPTSKDSLHECSEDSVLNTPPTCALVGSTSKDDLHDLQNCSISEPDEDEDSRSFQHHRLVAEPDPVEQRTSTETEVTQSRYGSIDSVSTRSLGAQTFLNGEPEACNERSFRVKHLSWHSSNTGSGPTLKIFADADAVILGREDSVPAVPALPKPMSGRVADAHPADPLLDRASQHMLVDMSSAAPSRTSTLSSSRTDPGESIPVRISLIRSMQAPRELGFGDISQKSASTSTQPFVKSSKGKAGSEADLPNRRSLVETLHEITVLQPQSNVVPRFFADGKGNIHSSDNNLAVHQGEALEEHPQVPRANTLTPQTTARKRVRTTETTSRSASFKSAVTQSKTSPLVPSLEHLEAQVSRYAGHPPSLASSIPARSTPIQAGVRPLGPSRPEVQESRVQFPAVNSRHTTSDDTETVEELAIHGTLKMKAKRSFRNIFHRRDPKITPRPDKKRNAKRSSVAGSALAQRFRDSTNFSKISLVRSPVASSVPKPDATASAVSMAPSGKRTGSRATLSTLDPSPAKSLPSSELANHHDTATVIHRILDRVTSLSEESSDRLRGLEIAEAILHTVESSKAAALSAELARKHARDAELHAERAGLELKRLAKLCEPDFDDETVRSIEQLNTHEGAP